ncbi:MAG: MFS transporter [bacterium]|nr:MFS transporter [bacterium]
MSNKIGNTISYCVGFLAFGMVAALLGPTLSRLAQNTHSPLNQVSFLFTARSVGYMLGAFALGGLYDRYPGHPLLAGGLCIMALTTALTPVVPLLWLLALTIFLTGIGESMVEVGNNTLIVWVVERKQIGSYMNILHFFFGAGAFISPVIVAKSLELTDNIRWAYWIVAGLMLPAVFWILSQKSPQIQGVSTGGAVERIDYMLVGLICLLFWLYVGAEIGFGGWIHTYAVKQGLSNESSAAYLTSAFWGALTVGRLLAVPLAARLRPLTVLLLDFLGCILSILLLLLSDSLAGVWIGTIGFGLSMASFFPTMLAFAERRIRISGRITSWFGIGAALGAMTLPLLIGQLIEPFGLKAIMAAILVDLLAALSIFGALVLYSARRKIL